MSLWASAGASPNEVAARAGHTSVAVVLDRYRHLFPAEITRTTGRLEAMFAPVNLTPPASVVDLRRLTEFYAELRDDGRGGAAYDPAMMVAVLIYAYCVGERSSRRIERRLVEDIAFRVVAANQCPDHATLARFRARHQEAVAGLFSQVLGLCVAEGLVAAGVVSIDSTKIEANASAWSNRTRREIAEEILAEAQRIDAAEDFELGDRRGGELPTRWAGRRDRRPRLAEALRQLEDTGRLTGRAIRPSGRPRKPRPGDVYRDANHKRAAERPRCGRPTPPIPTAACSGPEPLPPGLQRPGSDVRGPVIVATEMTDAANDSTMFEPLVAATEANLAAAGRADAVGAYTADAGYWSVPNATLQTDAEILIAPMPATHGITDPDDPRIAERNKVLERHEARGGRGRLGQLTPPAWSSTRRR